MVIDKWTRISNNNSLAIPLLGHKSKETFAELKKEYERLHNLNHKFKNNSKNSSIPNNLQNQANDINFDEIKNYIDKINSIMLKVNELITENNNYEKENLPPSEDKDIKSITNDILIEYNLFLDNIKNIKKDNYDSNHGKDFNSLFKESQAIVDEINKTSKKEDEDDKNEENIIIPPQEQIRRNNNNNNNNDLNRNIDRGHINIFNSRREFNNSIPIVKHNFQFTIEEEGLSNGIKLGLFFMVVLFVLFIVYICIP